MERAKGIEPSCEAWKASVLPLNYARLSAVALRRGQPASEAQAAYYRRLRCQFTNSILAPHERAASDRRASH